MIEEGISVASLSRRISIDLDLIFFRSITCTLRNYYSCQYQFFSDSGMLTLLHKFINGLAQAFSYRKKGLRVDKSYISLTIF